jgi:hypothetical protein
MPVVIPPHEIADPCLAPDFPASARGGSRDQNPGVFGFHCAGGAGVQGHSATGAGIRGESDNLVGVFGRSVKGDGVQGRSAAVDHSGVSAINETGGYGLYASSNGGEAGHFEGRVTIKGDIQVTQNLGVTGNVNVEGDVRFINGDIAERFPVAAAFTPGMVMILDETGRLTPCACSYDKRVVGVVSGAGDLKPAVTLRCENAGNHGATIALVGTVLCLADASQAAVEVGDLLTTSSTPGHAMKAADTQRAFGTAIGKALAPLASGRGLVPVVVSLL